MLTDMVRKCEPPVCFQIGVFSRWWADHGVQLCPQLPPTSPVGHRDQQLCCENSLQDASELNCQKRTYNFHGRIAHWVVNSTATFLVILCWMHTWRWQLPRSPTIWRSVVNPITIKPANRPFIYHVGSSHQAKSAAIIPVVNRTRKRLRVRRLEVLWSNRAM